MTSQLPLARSSSMSLAKPLTKRGENHYSHNHLQSLLDGFVDFSGFENCDLTFKGLSINSKKVHEEYLFLACASVGNTSQHGVAYAGEAINLGATCIAWEPTTKIETMPVSCPAERAEGKINVPLVRVETLHEKIGEIASRFYKHPSHSLNVIGITGTNGKTSTAHFIAQLTHLMDKKCSVIGTLGNGFYGQLEQSTHTTPDAVTLQELISNYRDERADMLVMEVSSHALSQGRVNGVEFDCAILTNLTRDHLDYHGDMKSYADEKLKLFHFSSLKQIVVNCDDSFSEEIIASLKSENKKVSIVTYSRKNKSADYYADDITLDANGISFSLHVNNLKNDKKDFLVRTQLVGDFNVENLLASIAALDTQGYGSQQGYDIKTIISNINKLAVVPGRMEKVTQAQLGVSDKNLPLIVIDYAHTPDALKQGLCALKAHTRGNLICLFGCGGDRDKGKRPLMAKVAEQYADKVIVTSDNPRTESAKEIIEEIIRGFSSPDHVVTEADRKKAIYTALNSMSSDDVVLIAGKGHEDYQEINGKRIHFSDKECIMSFYSDSVHLKNNNQESH